jgi:hypothetical protein
VTYAQQLLDPRWLKLRFFKLQSVGWRCERCGHKDRPFHVHHPKYKLGAAPWEYWITDLEALCDKCHAERHGLSETSPELRVLYQAMAHAHACRNWNEMMDWARFGMEAIERGAYYKGLV